MKSGSDGCWINRVPSRFLDAEQLPLPGRLKLTILELEAIARTDAFCWPSNSTLASRLGKTPRAVQADLDDLERRGWIHRLYEDDERRVRVGILLMERANPELPAVARDAEAIGGARVALEEAIRARRGETPEAGRARRAKAPSHRGMKLASQGGAKAASYRGMKFPSPYEDSIRQEDTGLTTTKSDETSSSSRNLIFPEGEGIQTQDESEPVGQEEHQVEEVAPSKTATTEEPEAIEETVVEDSPELKEAIEAAGSWEFDPSSARGRVLEAVAKGFDPAWIPLAVEKTRHRSRDWGYTLGILENWKKTGGPSRRPWKKAAAYNPPSYGEATAATATVAETQATPETRPNHQTPPGWVKLTDRKSPPTVEEADEWREWASNVDCPFHAAGVKGLEYYGLPTSKRPKDDELELLRKWARESSPRGDATRKRFREWNIPMIDPEAPTTARRQDSTLRIPGDTPEEVAANAEAMMAEAGITEEDRRRLNDIATLTIAQMRAAAKAGGSK